MRSIYLTVLTLIITLTISAQKNNYGIGLALSGGGAKGLAHIGILKAIDSAGLNIDYITGTSMGSIVGGLYAAGYSADSIEVIARKIDWGVVLSNTMPMTYLTMEEKSEFEKYALELPLKDFKLKIPAGFLESQELWITLEKYFYPVAGINNFDQFSIPFRCVANNLLTGEVAVLGKGSIVSSVRSSMALPGIFSPIDIDSNRLIDGGVLRNLPVKEVIDMGAKYAIGVSVSSPVSSLAELENAFAVTTQAIFINDQKSYAEQTALCNQFIKIPMGVYSSGDFDLADKIIDLGIETGRQYYPYFKHLADSLKAAHPDYTFRTNRLPNVDAYKVTSTNIVGLNKKEKEAFEDQIYLGKTDSVYYQQIEDNSRRAFAYRMYKSIITTVQRVDSNNYQLDYRVKPESYTKVKVGLSENRFTGFGIHLNLTARNKIAPSSRTMVSLNLGENFRAMLEHLQMFGYKAPMSSRFRVYYEAQKVPTYDNFKKTGEYALNYLQIDNRFQVTAKRKAAGGIGMQWEYLNAQPKIETGMYLDGWNNYFNFYAFWEYNNLEKPLFPVKGTTIDVTAGYVAGLSPSYKVYQDGQYLGNVSKDILDYGNYVRSTISINNFLRLHKKFTWVNKLYGGANFSESSSLLNNFYGGGMNPTFRNQIQMVGILEGEASSESMISLQGGPRYHPFGGLYVTLTGGVMTYDFIKKNTPSYTEEHWLLGAGLTFAYDTPIGPLEFTLMSSSKTEGLRTYFNLGFPFK